MDNTQKVWEKKTPLKSSILKSGKRNFFFDVYTASNSKKYLKITESRVPEEGEEKGKRTSFILFPEDIKDFQDSLNGLVAHLS